MREGGSAAVHQGGAELGQLLRQGLRQRPDVDVLGEVGSGANSGAHAASDAAPDVASHGAAHAAAHAQPHARAHAAAHPGADAQTNA